LELKRARRSGDLVPPALERNSGLPLSATPVLPDRFPSWPYVCANQRHAGKRGQQRRHRVNQILPGDFHACLYTRQEAI